MYDRESFLKSMPKPKNEDVIIYDTSLNNLIDKDVFLEYEKLYPIFINKKEEYLKLREEISVYETFINNLFLCNKSWTIEDYLRALQNDKKTYSNLYNEVKKDENNIQILNKKIASIDEKIKIQQIKEEKKNQERKENVDNEIEKNKEELSRFKSILSSYQDSLNQVNKNIQENEEDFKLFSLMQEQLDIGEYRCIYCGSKVKIKNMEAPIFKRLLRNLENNKIELQKLLSKKEKVELNISYYENEISKIKERLNNAISFKKNKDNTYQKKSIEILKLEALKDELLTKINEFQDKINNNHSIHSEEYKKIKSRITQYEESINNLNKIHEMKENKIESIKKYNQLEQELKSILYNLNNYIKFISIYYKIIEQKVSEYCGSNFKFKFAKIEDYKIEKIFDIYFKGIEYSQLSALDKKDADKIIIEKISIYF